MAVKLPSFHQETLANRDSIQADVGPELKWRVLIQRTNGRNIPYALGIHGRDSGEEVMKKLRRLYIEETNRSYRVFAQTILMRKPVVSVVRITAVCPQTLAFLILPKRN